MTLLATCRACGKDCSRMNATFDGDVYHIACLPRGKRQKPPVDASAALKWLDDHGDLGPLSPPGKGEVQGVFKPMHEPFHLDSPPKGDT